jgi:hypothetical protein
LHFFFHSGTRLPNAGLSGILAIKKNCTKVEGDTLHVHAAGYEKAYALLTCGKGYNFMSAAGD